MMTHRSVVHLAALAAALVVALQPLWMLLAQGRPNVPSLVMPLCGADGGVSYPGIAASDAPLDRPETPYYCGHCALCAFSAQLPVLPHLVAGMLAAAISAAPAVFVRVPDRKSASRLAAQPRAPPAPL